MSVFRRSLNNPHCLSRTHSSSSINLMGDEELRSLEEKTRIQMNMTWVQVQLYLGSGVGSMAAG